MNINPPQSQALSHYKQYANSTIHLNQALNSQLSNCYDRISRMIKDSTETEKIKQEQQQEILRLNRIIQSQQKIRIIQPFKQFVSVSVQTESQTILDLDVQSYYQVQQTEKQQILNQQIQALLLSKLQVQIQLEMQRMKQGDSPQQNINKYNNQILKLSQKNTQIFQQNQCLFQQLNFIKHQHKKLFEQSSSRIHEQHQRIKLLEYQLENSKSQTIKIRYAQPPVINFNQDTKIKQNNVRKIQELQEKIGLLEAQNRHFRNSAFEFQRKTNQNEQIKQQALMENQLRTIKEEYSKVMKQNMNYIEINSRLEKNSIMFARQLELLRKQKSELTLKMKELMMQIDQSNNQLIKSQTKIQQLNSTLSLRQSECFNMKKSLNSEMLQKLGCDIRSGRDILTSRRRDTSEVPVRDSSVMSKSRSSAKVISIKEAPTSKRF